MEVKEKEKKQNKQCRLALKALFCVYLKMLIFVMRIKKLRYTASVRESVYIAIVVSQFKDICDVIVKCYDIVWSLTLCFFVWKQMFLQSCMSSKMCECWWLKTTTSPVKSENKMRTEDGKKNRYF